MFETAFAPRIFLWTAALAAAVAACGRGGPSPALNPEEELATFRLEEGLRIELVAAEPLVEDPVVIHFDEDGRLWVVEMRGFMPNLEMDGEDDPVGRISVLTDRDGDGRMDAGTVFLDSLVLPRALAFVPGGVLVAENKPLWFVEDLDGDLKADRRTLLDPTYGEQGLPEHSPNGLWRNIDNWYYNARSSWRYRFGPGHQLIRDSTEFRGQWGISHDDAGRLYYNYNWSQLHADLAPANYLSRNPNHVSTSGTDHGLTIDRRVYPVRANPAVNRGYIPGTPDAEGRLLEFTSPCAPLVYRGDLLPPEYKGNAFVCEPAGNLVKRNVVQEKGPVLSAYDPHPGREFLASTDERFRPVYLANGPDGALYIADMYRGVNQHGAYMTPYLKEQTIRRKLDAPIHKGRIWRIAPEGRTYRPGPRLSEAGAEELIAALSSGNGWLRDAAQRVLIEQNRPEHIPLLERTALKGEKEMGRLHALWTLEGMGKASPEILFSTLDDPRPLIRIASLRILEPLAGSDPALRARMGRKMAEILPAAEAETALQIALSAGILDQKAKTALLSAIAHRYADSPLMRDAVLSSLVNDEFIFLQHLSADAERQGADLNREILFEMLAAAIARKGDPAELTALLRRLDRPEMAYSWQEKAVLNGLAVQADRHRSNPIELSTPPAFSGRMERYSPAVRNKLRTLSTLFDWPGKRPVRETDERREPDASTLQAVASGRTHYLSTCAGCHGADGEGLKRFAPPLVNSEWVLGDEKKLTLILLHGLEGPVEVNGRLYDAPDILPVMPSHSTMDDRDIADILTYIRNEWGHQAAPVSGRTVARTRVTSQGRVMPWTQEELLHLPPEPEEKTQ